MMSQNTMAILNETVLYEIKNIDETIAYCMKTNGFLSGKSFDAVKLSFLENVQTSFDKAVNQNNKSFFGSQQQVFGAFYHIDFDQLLVLEVDGKKYGPGFYNLNFFVRLGREAVNG